MRLPTRTEYLLGVGWLAVVAAILTPAWLSHAQPINQATAKPAAPVNSLPNPYRSVENWARMPEGRPWGASAGVYVDPTGTSVWVAERCGANSCVGSDLPPILHFDMSGRLLKAFGAGMFVFPHGIFVDQDQNVWVTDGQGKDGKGHQVFKFSPEGKVLLTLARPGGRVMVPTSSTRRRRCWSLPTATSSWATGMAATPIRGSSSSTGTASSSRPGG